MIRDVGTGTIGGRQLDRPDEALEHAGDMGPLLAATDERVKAARNNLRELTQLEKVAPNTWLDSDGVTWVLVRGYTDYSDPHASGATAFTILDGYCVNLKRADAEDSGLSRPMGDMGGRRVA